MQPDFFFFLFSFLFSETSRGCAWGGAYQWRGCLEKPASRRLACCSLLVVPVCRSRSSGLSVRRCRCRAPSAPWAPTAPRRGPAGVGGGPSSEIPASAGRSAGRSARPRRRGAVFDLVLKVKRSSVGAFEDAKRLWVGAGKTGVHCARISCLLFRPVLTHCCKHGQGRPTLKTQRSFVFEDEAALVHAVTLWPTHRVARPSCCSPKVPRGPGLRSMQLLYYLELCFPLDDASTEPASQPASQQASKQASTHSPTHPPLSLPTCTHPNELGLDPP